MAVMKPRQTLWLGPLLFFWMAGVMIGAPEASVSGIRIEPAQGEGTMVVISASTPLYHFQCSLPSPKVSDLLIDLIGISSGSESHYTFGNAIISEALVEPREGGVRIRIPVGGLVVASIEQAGGDLRVRLAPAPARQSRGDFGDTGGYRIGAGDKIAISVYGHDDLDKVVEVHSDGTIDYPLIGDLKVEGKSVSQVKEELTHILGKDFLVDPEISVDIQEYGSQWVTILGEVRNSGRYSFKRSMRLIDLLAEAGGVTREAGTEILITRRQGENDPPQQIVIDREKLMSRDNHDANIALANADIITVSQQDVFYMRGEVIKPGPYYLSGDTTVLKAISLAGGFGPFANRKEVELLRSGKTGVSKRIIVNVRAIERGKKPDVPVAPGDIIIVPRRIF
jgi:polysaccharide biosynthesis/export protein